MPFLDILFTSWTDDDFHVRRTIVGPMEAHPELVVDPDAVLAFPIVTQGLRPIASQSRTIIPASVSMACQWPLTGVFAS